jgi:hypothetical protein
MDRDLRAKDADRQQYLKAASWPISFRFAWQKLQNFGSWLLDSWKENKCFFLNFFVLCNVILEVYIENFSVVTYKKKRQTSKINYDVISRK